MKLASTLLALILGLIATQRADAERDFRPEPVKAASRFVEAVRAGDADAIRSTLAQPVDEKWRDVQERWVQSLVKGGPQMPEEQLSVTGGGSATGNISTVRGRFGPRNYIRLWQTDGQWKVLMPGDAAKAYGLTAAESRILDSMEASALKQWGAPVKPTPPAPPSDPETSPANEDSSEASGAGRAAAGPNPAVAVVAPLLVEHLSKSDMRVQEKALKAILDAGDPQAARRLLDEGGLKLLDYEAMPRVAMSFPGGVAGAEAQPFYAKSNMRLDMVGIQEGMALAYAHAGNVPQALAVARRLEEWGSSRSLVMKMLRLDPNETYLKALQAGRDPEKEDALVAQAYALAALGRDEELEGVLQKHAELLERESLLKHKAEDATQAAFFGWLRRGDFDRAQQYIDARSTRQTAAAADAYDPKQATTEAEIDRANLTHSLAAAMALRSDLEEVRAVVEAAKALRYKGERLSLVLTYVHARQGDWEAAQNHVDTVAETPRDRAMGWGIIADAAHEAGNSRVASHYGKVAAEFAAEQPTPEAKVAVATGFLEGVAMGPDAVVRGHWSALSGASPLR